MIGKLLIKKDENIERNSKDLRDFLGPDFIINQLTMKDIYLQFLVKPFEKDYYIWRIFLKGIDLI